MLMMSGKAAAHLEASRQQVYRWRVSYKQAAGLVEALNQTSVGLTFIEISQTQGNVQAILDHYEDQSNILKGQ
jgi:hypothetical protein